MTNDLKALRDGLEAKVAEAARLIKSFPRGAMGITPDQVKFSPEYRAAKAGFNTAFNALREFNEKFSKAVAA